MTGRLSRAVLLTIAATVSGCVILPNSDSQGGGRTPPQQLSLLLRNRRLILHKSTICDVAKALSVPVSSDARHPPKHMDFILWLTNPLARRLALLYYEGEGVYGITVNQEYFPEPIFGTTDYWQETALLLSFDKNGFLTGSSRHVGWSLSGYTGFDPSACESAFEPKPAIESSAQEPALR